MIDIEQKFSVCPVCGKKLVEIRANIKNNYYYLCTDSSCRTNIESNIITKLDIEDYCKLQDKYNLNAIEKHCDAYMLLKENLSGPMLIKNSNEVFEKYKNSYCIIKAKSLEDAIEQFKNKFKYIKISKDMVVPITIREV